MVWLVEDDAAICEIMIELFEMVKLPVVHFENGVQFLEDFNHQWQGCIILDVRLPGMSGLEIQNELTLRKNRLPILFVTGHGDVPMAVRAMKNGAFDFISKPFNNQELIDRVQRAIVFSNTKQNKIKTEHSLQNLTPKELEILNLIVEGKQNKEIAFTMNISISNVEAKRSKIMQKLNAKNLAELVRYYLSCVE